MDADDRGMGAHGRPMDANDRLIETRGSLLLTPTDAYGRPRQDHGRAMGIFESPREPVSAHGLPWVSRVGVHDHPKGLP